MARQKGSANFAGTLEVLAGGPIDSRSIVPTLADLTVASNFPYPYQYMEVRVTATGKKYKLVGNDLTIAANWVEIEETGGSSITVDSALSTTSENPVQNKVITTEINKKANATALDSKADLVDGKVPASQLPSYVDDVLEYASASAFPATGETGKIYIALDTNKTYRWSGSAYVEISESLALGETSSTAYRGDRGAEAYAKANKAYLSDDTAFNDVNDADYIPVYDTSASAKKKTLWSNIKSLLKTYFDGFYYSRTDSAITSLDDADVIPVYDDSDTAKRKITWNNLKNEIVSLGIGGGYAPVGTIISFMGNTAPQDYLACNGATYNIADYPQLANFFQAQFGSKNYFGGNGTTTFKVPDLRGEFLRGTGTNGHTSQGSGDNVGTHQDASTFPHSWGDSSKIYVYNSTTGGAYFKNGDSTHTLATVHWRGITAEDKTDTPASPGPYELTVRPTNTSIMWCIKAVAAGEVYSTTERVVGTWIDGRPVYQKSADFTLSNLGGSVSSYRTQNLISTTTFMPNYKDVVDIKGCINWTSGGKTGLVPLSMYGPTAEECAIYPQIDPNGNMLQAHGYGDWSGSTLHLTLQYTKTTD